MRRLQLILSIAAIVVSAVIALTGCDEDSIERQLGSMTASSVEQSYHVSSDPLLQEWISNMGRALVANSQRQNIPYEYKVIQTDIVNAFAAPYGHVYICEGLIDFAKSEDEVWVVTAHETGHVVNRHAIKSAKKNFLYSIGLSILGNKNEGAAQVAGIGLGLLSLKYSRDDERQADDYGTMLAYRAGHDPQANIEFFTRLAKDVEKNPPSKLEEYFLTHPDTASRIARQKLRPENDPTNVNALVHVARGYMSRAQYAHAIGLLDKAVALQPQASQPQILLADAYSARGQYTKASPLYQAAAQLEPDNTYARQSFQLASTAQVPALPAMTDAEKTQAQAILAAANMQQMQPAALRGDVAKLVSGISARVAPVTAASKSMTNSLTALGENEKELSETAQKAVVGANAAINKAAEPTYQLEAIQDRITSNGEALVSLISDGRTRLQAAVDGQGNAGDAAILQRTITEAAKAMGDLIKASDLAKDAVPVTAKAQESASNTLGIVRDIMRLDKESTALNAMAEAAARDTTAKAQAALAAADSARQATTQAQMRTIVARINIAALGADPALQRAYDNLVSTYTFARPNRIQAMRQQGLGYGDAALCLAVSRSGGLEPTEIANLGQASNSMVDAAAQTHAPIRGASLLLKFLAQAMEEEGTTLATK